MPRMNDKWTIETAIRLNEREEVVLATRPNKYMLVGDIEYVTWYCMDGNNYFWGHYHCDKKTAMLDLLERAKEEIERM